MANFVNQFSNTSFTTPSVVSSVTIASGGYKMIGKLVIVQMRFSLSGTTSGSIATFPKPANAISGSPQGTVVTLANNQMKNISIDGNGSLLSPDGNVSGTVIISGVYMSA